ncbi:DUF4442 domain-containing protein [Bacteriovoracaceae bacterium]|nr:DUF4442 domain-containing protein [Bacteriovoracaceae bacterium]
MRRFTLESLDSPRLAMKMISYWPPYFFSGIKVVDFNDDLTQIKVRLKTSLINRNYKGTHFGGSLYSMIDPFYMFMMIHAMGPGYRVWDISAKIDFIKATSNTVLAEFKLEPKVVKKVKNLTSSGEKHIESFLVEIREEVTNELVASAVKDVYVRKKLPKGKSK